MRETLSLAHDREVTYLETVAIAKEVAEDLIEDNSPLIESIQSDLVRLFRERAALRSNAESRAITASDLLSDEIGRVNREIASATNEEQARNTRLCQPTYYALTSVDESLCDYLKTRFRMSFQ